MKLQYLFACLGLAATTGLGAASCTAGPVDPDESDPEPGVAPETPEADTPEADEEDVSSDSEALSCRWNGSWCGWNYQCCSGWCRWNVCSGGGGGGYGRGDSN